MEQCTRKKNPFPMFKITPYIGNHATPYTGTHIKEKKNYRLNNKNGLGGLSLGVHIGADIIPGPGPYPSRIP